MINLIDELEREKAHSDGMKEAAHMWMRRAQDAQRALAIAVYASGGEIVVYRHHLEDGGALELIREDRPDDMTVRYRATIKSKSED